MTLPAIECRTWCYDQEGHVSANFAEDQWCMGDAPAVSLSKGEAELSSNGVSLPSVYVGLANNSGQDEMLMDFGRNVWEVRMTAAEGRQLAHALTEWAGVLEASQTEYPPISL